MHTMGMGRLRSSIVRSLDELARWGKKVWFLLVCLVFTTAAMPGYAEVVDEKLAWLFVKRAGKLLIPEEGSFRLRITGDGETVLLATVKRATNQRWLVETSAPRLLSGRKLLVRGELLTTYDPSMKRIVSLSPAEAAPFDILGLFYVVDPTFWYTIKEANKDDNDVLQVLLACRLASCLFQESRLFIAQKGSRLQRIVHSKADGTLVSMRFGEFLVADYSEARTLERTVGNDEKQYFVLDQFDAKPLPDVIFSQHLLSR